jgi:hypothetical protein
VGQIEYKLTCKVVHSSCCVSFADYFSKYSQELSVLERKLQYPVMERELMRLFHLKAKSVQFIYDIIKAKHSQSLSGLLIGHLSDYLQVYYDQFSPQDRALASTLGSLSRILPAKKVYNEENQL